MNFKFKGEIIKLKLDQESLTITRLNGESVEIVIKVNDKPEVELKSCEVLTQKYKKVGYHHYVYESQK